jgi:hypothetical protein
MMKSIVIRFLPLLLFVSSFSASMMAQRTYPSQTPAPKPPPTAEIRETESPCPTLNVQAQPGPMVRDGQRVSFYVNITGGDPKVMPTIIWNTTAGAMIPGQDTRRVNVDTTGAGGTAEREIRADVWIGGYDGSCLLQASGTVKIIPPAAKFGEFGEVDADTLKKHIDELSSFLSQTPDSLYVIAYAGRNSERGYTSNSIRRIRLALDAAGVAPNRTTFTDGGFREEPLFEFWTVPAGAEMPRATPTIKRSEIVYPKPVPKALPAKKP